jgi:F0F1-type ATP synthase membrane subunit b/b'
MNFKAFCLLVVLSVLPVITPAQEMSLEEQLAQAKEQIAEAEKRNEELQGDLKMKEQEIAELRAKVDKLDAMIEEAREGGVK